MNTFWIGCTLALLSDNHPWLSWASCNTPHALCTPAGKFADLEIKVVLSIELAMLPVGHKIMDGLMVCFLWF